MILSKQDSVHIKQDAATERRTETREVHLSSRARVTLTARMERRRGVVMLASVTAPKPSSVSSEGVQAILADLDDWWEMGEPC